MLRPGGPPERRLAEGNVSGWSGGRARRVGWLGLVLLAGCTAPLAPTVPVAAPPTAPARSTAPSPVAAPPAVEEALAESFEPAAATELPIPAVAPPPTPSPARSPPEAAAPHDEHTPAVPSPTSAPVATSTPIATATPGRGRALLLQDAAGAATPPGAAPLVTAPALVALVEQHLGGLPGIFGVAIKALAGGHGVLVNADRPFPAASLFKLPVMYEVYRQRDAGRLSLAEQLTMTPRFAALDLGTLDVPVGGTVSVEGALHRMIAISDNATANLLADRVGWNNLNATMRDLGLRETRLDGEALTTSPRDMLLLLELLARGQGPSPASSAEMIDLLLAQRINDRLPARLPPGTAVAHKTGNLEGVIHDVGIVYAPGAPFVIALLAEQAPNYGPVAQAQAALTRAVYDYLVMASGGPPPSSPEPGVVPTATSPPTVAPPATAVSLPPPRPTARIWQPPTATPDRP
jgi:beta-lactamase class A